MKRMIQWLIQPDVAPLVARLALVLLTALVVEPSVAVPLGVLGEAAANASRR